MYIVYTCSSRLEQDAGGNNKITVGGSKATVARQIKTLSSIPKTAMPLPQCITFHLHKYSTDQTRHKAFVF